MSRASEGQGGCPAPVRLAQRSSLTSVVQYLESRPVPNTSRTARTPGLQAPPPRRLLGPFGMLGKRNYHHHSRAETGAERRGAMGQENSSHTSGGILHNGQSSSTGFRTSGNMMRKRRPNWIDAPDDSFFLVSRETRKMRKLLSRSQLHRACRRPCEQIAVRWPSQGNIQAPPHLSLRNRGPIVIHD